MLEISSFRSGHYQCAGAMIAICALIAIISLATGCASETYRFGNPKQPFRSIDASQSNTCQPNMQVTIGGEHPNLDRLEKDWRTEKLLYPQIYGSFGGDLVSQATSLVPSFAYFPFYVKPILSVGGNIGGNAAGTMVLKRREKEIEAREVATSSGGDLRP